MMSNPEITSKRVPLGDMVKVCQRELALRKAVYPSRVANGKMKDEEAVYQTHAMDSIVKFLQWAADNEKAVRELYAKTMPSESAYAKATRGE
jgi:hypothetical protein